MEVDYLIIGQGICGTLLSRQLLQHGKTIMVIDEGSPLSCSKAAGGIINPVTGKRLVSSWLIDQLLPFAWDTYTSFGAELGTPIIQRSDILDFYPIQETRSIFIERQEDGNEYLGLESDEEQWAEYFRFNYGIGKIAPCMLVDIGAMLSKWRQRLNEGYMLRQEKFDLQQCTITNDGVVYKGVKAKKILFCDGVASMHNPYFDRLPWSADKGEALAVSIPGLPATQIYKQGNISIVPWRSGLFWVGAAHDWKFTDMQPSAAFRKRVEEQLNYWLKLPYTVIDHLVAQRPANVDRKPFAGLHPLHPAVGIFNGMGGKGCSLAPYFAHQFAQHLVNGTPITPVVDVCRYRKILSRESF
ncbi:MAG: dependent oxidoreductase [Flavipsychrobacter sp.]|nr:dependent oxidoreductase [Flavipsychrobacter sp.]